MSEPVDRSVLRARIDVVSSKAAAAFDNAVDSVAGLLTAEDLTTWVDLGCAIAAGSAVTAVKYFRESPSFFDPLPRERRSAVIRIARALARHEPNVALELLRYGVPLAEQLDDAALTEWGRIGSAIADQDYDSAIEFVHESAALAGLIPTDAFSLWGEIGMALSKEDRAVKDFSSLTYFRSSAEWVGAVADPPLRPLVLALGYKIVVAEFPPGAARRPGHVALDVLRYAPTLLGSLPSDQTRRALLTAGIRVAECAPGLVEIFLRHAPEVIRLVEGSVTRFDEWVSEGLSIAGSHRERAEAYFSLRSKQGIEVAQRLSNGVFLRDIKPTLTFVAEAMCGLAVEIRPGAGASSALSVSGGTITLPERITVYPTLEENLRFYRVLTSHEAAHLEFGTYGPVSPDVAGWFGIGPHDADGAASLMRRFPDPQLAQNLWTIAEEARIDFLLRHHYPGLRADIDHVLFEQLRMRPKIETLGRRESILESILQLSVADTADVPLPVLEPVTQAYDVIKRLRDPGATVQDVLRAVVDLYPLVAERLETAGHAPEQSEPPVEPRSEFDQLAMGHAPIGSFAFRDALQAPQLTMGQRGGPQSAEPPDRSRPFEAVEPPAAEAARPAFPLGDHATVGSGSPDAGFWYDEWDHAALEYKPRWCRVQQLPAANGGDDEAAALLAETRGVEMSLRRYFAVIRPEAFRKAMRQPDGEEIDLDAAVAAAADRRARMTPSDRLYIRREKRVRDVAAAVLVDASGSTGRQISGSGRSRRVIDVARESLALLGSALDALGDQFALYAFSGQSRQGVNCRVVKAFDEPFGPTALARISGLAPSGQNRDGAAIRHVTRRLHIRDAAVKLLIVLSDGRPLDDDYAGDYALEDTRAALRECRAAGVQPFCVTVDDAADRYIERLYGEVRYTVIPDVEALPERLPQLYRRLTT